MNLTAADYFKHTEAVVEQTARILSIQNVHKGDMPAKAREAVEAAHATQRQRELHGKAVQAGLVRVHAPASEETYTATPPDIEAMQARLARLTIESERRMTATAAPAAPPIRRPPKPTPAAMVQRCGVPGIVKTFSASTR